MDFKDNRDPGPRLPLSSPYHATRSSGATYRQSHGPFLSPGDQFNTGNEGLARARGQRDTWRPDRSSASPVNHAREEGSREEGIYFTLSSGGVD